MNSDLLNYLFAVLFSKEVRPPFAPHRLSPAKATADQTRRMRAIEAVLVRNGY